ncbi:MoaD/ThiS family protein [Neolewinella aurantiaca]|uniref:Molybdopterin synthase sulfur carrier subunit n=1 Tax=Neolewinella aurantiaca TaxID=2602767 RepID=A0A5C7FJB6_9BACT|nr:MoaD/ThiS family protein [Neolewinella aurantiaca]TXF90736.1 MoaD/ThiS family protein [Neolewinella aurantiaca]
MEKITLLCFGVARDITGAGNVSLHLRPRPSVADVRQQLIADYPAFGELVSFAIARNEEYADPDEVVENGDVLAIIPPVSGG